MLRMDMITKVDKLFFPIKSQAKQDERLVKSLFNKSKMLSEDFFLHQIADFGTWAEVNFQTCSGENILSENYLQQIKKIHGSVLEMADLDQVCAKRNGQCLVDGADLLEPKFYEAFLLSSMIRKSSLHQWDQSYDRKNFRFYVNFGDSGTIGFTDLSYNLGKHFRVNFQNESNDGKEAGFARLVKLRYNLKDNADSAQSAVINWELQFLKLMKNLTNGPKECNDKNGMFKISYAASQSLDSEMTNNVSLDIGLVVGTFSLIIIFACLFMSLGTNLVTSPSYVLPFAGIAAAFFGISSSFGLCSYLNYPGCNLIFVIPFLVIGIGIDDMFLIYSSFQHIASKKTTQTSKEKILEEVICKTLSRSGVSITITSLTDFTAFLVGITTGFKSVQIFCVYAGISILFCYFYQITFFTGFLCWHCRRVLEQRNAFLPWLKAQPKQLKIKFFDLKKFKQKWLKIWEFFICHKAGKLLTFLLFLVYISTSAWHAYHIHEGIDLKDLVSEDSYYSAYVEDNSQLNDLYPIVMLVMHQPIDYDQMQNRILVKNLIKNSHKIKGISDSFGLNWLDMFKSDKIEYKDSAKNLINTLKDYPPFLNDIVLKKTYFDYQLNRTVSAGYFAMSDLDSGQNVYQYEIEASRFYLQYSELHLSSLDAMPMHLLRKVCQESGLPVFPYSITFKYYEQFEETLPNVIQSFVIALESMYLIALIFVPDLVSVFCIIASMLSIMTGLVGFMHLWGLSLSSITMIELIMSVGFCVDFSAHVTHAFITNGKGDRNKRAYKAFLHVGVPIFNSAVSTIVGISLLGFCKSYIFKSFFKTMIILMSLGILNSLLFLPVLLSLIGPHWPMHQEAKQQMREEEMVCLNGQKSDENV
ncbi:Patched domain-containing 3 [Brachionus plicatilis]|uniref:Patched domain-containing 3 n=1 Tax=Brachionus plicatilis TaxID=10195 RepID=A0A3M7S4F9_BRAPC|nr:Patched domain-containing 3 [Brachionus plicatilis]